MKFLATVLLTLFIYSSSFTQVAISARYATNNSAIYDNFYEVEDALKAGVELGIGYWFRLKNKRMEFIPELSYTYMLGKGNVSGKSINLNFNTLIYPLDFHSDCDACPTFSKDGGLIKKGFHWIISPSLFKTTADGTPVQQFSEFTFDQIGWRVGVGAGLDIGLANVLTLSPFIMYNRGGSLDYNDSAIDNSYKQIHLGLRTILRFDKNKW